MRNMLCALAVLLAVTRSAANPVHPRIPNQWRSFIFGTS
jgi:hypothetical protein